MTDSLTSSLSSFSARSRVFRDCSDPITPNATAASRLTKKLVSSNTAFDRTSIPLVFLIGRTKSGFVSYKLISII